MFKHLYKTMFQQSKSIYSAYKNVRSFCTTASNSMDAESDRIAWIDLEMTGLDVDRCHIMEVACIITDADLNIVAEGPDLVINHPSSILDNMDQWCVKQHGKTGLTEACRSSKVSLKEAEKIILNFFQSHIQPGMSPLAGSSIYMDRLFLKKHMPQIDSYLHYRLIDVSTVKELCRRWNPDIYTSAPKKQFLHRSLNDIKESIDELRWYREHFMNTQC